MARVRALGHDGRSVRADEEKAADADGEQTRKSPLHVQPERQDRVDAGVDDQKYDIGPNAAPVHYAFPPNSPCGRNNSNRTMSIKATAGLYAVSMTSVDNSCDMPMIMPPTMAPYGLPTPPKIAAANTGSNNIQPMTGRSWVSMPSMMPAAAARTAPRTHVSKIMRSVSMPDTAAKSMLSAIARIAFP